MSLLDGPDVVLVYREVQTVDSDGNPVRRPSATAITVRGRVQMLDATAQFMCRAFPAGTSARVEWDGRSWDVVGDPVRRSGSPATTHTVVTLRARTPEVLP